MAECIMIVDDEREITDLVALYLENERFTVFKCYSGQEAMDCISKEKLDLAILDVMLPDMNGFEICKRIRQNYTYPVIMLTAKIAEVDRITGLTLGADEDVIEYSGLVLNSRTRECTLNEKPLSLTPTEFAILKILCQKRGSVVSAEELFHSVWGEEYYTKNNNTITVHIRHLREKMGDSFESPKYIKTVWGVGYKIEN